MERAISISLLRALSGMAVKCPLGEKSPMKGWDPRSNTPEASRILIDEVEFSKNNFGLHLAGPMVDVDVDTTNPAVYAALDVFLPPTAYTWGRASKPRSHRLYALDDDFDPSRYPFLRTLSRNKDLNVEMRGGPVSRGEYSLLPGSVHPSGEMYAWDNIGRVRSATPARVPLRVLVGNMRKAMLATVLAGTWMEGVRQELTMAIAGTLFRVQSLLKSDDPEQFCMGKEESLQFFENFLECVDDDPTDRKDRIAAFNKTWEKAEGGANVTGATRIAEISGDKTIVATIYSLVADSPSLHELEKFLDQYAIWHGTGDMIDLNAAETGAKSIMSRMAASNSMGHLWYDAGDKAYRMVDYVYGLAATKRVHGFTFSPGKEKLVRRGDLVFVNEWGGFATQPLPGGATKDDVRPFLEYLWTVVANKRKDVYEFVLSWIADIFQDPMHKPGTALVLVGEPGAGKSFLGDTIRKLIGDTHSVQTNSLDRVTAKHNTHTAKKLLVQCDEATNAKQRQTASLLKSLITDLHVIIEPKGIDAYSLENHARYIFTSNEIYEAMHIPDGMADRRMVVIRVPSVRVGDGQYWSGINDWVSDNKQALMAYLMAFPYNKPILRRALATPEKVDMVSSSLSTTERWALSVVASGFPLSEPVHTVAAHTLHDGAIPSRIMRSSWPTHVARGPLFEALRLLAGEANKSTLPAVYNEIFASGFVRNSDVVKQVQVFDNRLGEMKSLSLDYLEIPAFEDFITTTTKAVGFAPTNIGKLASVAQEEEQGEF